MLLVVAYDVSCDRRRARLHRALSGWLGPVQKSVFEGRLVGGGLPPLERAVAAPAHEIGERGHAALRGRGAHAGP